MCLHLVELQILSLMIPAEKADDSDLVLEVTAGVGGQEAMLFTAEVFDMYRRFAIYQGWDFETLEYNPSDTGQYWGHISFRNGYAVQSATWVSMLMGIKMRAFQVGFAMALRLSADHRVIRR